MIKIGKDLEILLCCYVFEPNEGEGVIGKRGGERRFWTCLFLSGDFDRTILIVVHNQMHLNTPCFRL